MNERVVVTGIGAVSPLGLTAEETWQATVQGQNGIGPITAFDASEFSCSIAGEVKDWDAESLLGRRQARRADRFSQFALAATSAAGLVDYSSWRSKSTNCETEDLRERLHL